MMVFASRGKYTAWRRASHSIPLACLSIVLVCLSACGTASSADQSGGPPMDTLLSFASTISYDQALQETTDHGIQPGKQCSSGSVYNGTMYTGLWQPQGQQDTYAKTHQLYVFPGPTTPDSDYSYTAMQQLPGVRSQKSVPGIGPFGVASVSGTYLCPYVKGTPAPGVAEMWDGFDGWMSTTVTFAAPLDTYDAALFTISNLGLALDGPCYTSRPVGQERAFAATHTLVVQTASQMTSTTWQQQLRQTPGVVSVAQPQDHKAC